MSVPDHIPEGPGESEQPERSRSDRPGRPDRAGRPDGAEAGEPPVPRRGFLKAVVGEAIQTAASIGGAAAVAGQDPRGGGSGTQGDASPAAGDPEGLAALAGVGFSDIVVLDSAEAATPHGPAGFGAYRSPYGLDGDTLIVLDQRRFPGAVVDVPCLTAADAVQAIRDGLVQGAGTVAAVGAYAVAGAAAARGRGDPALEPAAALAAIEDDAATLLAAAPWVASLRNSLATLRQRAHEAAAAGAGAGAIAEDLRRTADAATMDELLGLSRLVAAGVGLLRDHAAIRRDGAHPLRVLVHGPVGALSFGQLGTAVGAIHAAAGVGIPVYAWIDEGRPGLSGVRTAWELGHAGVGYWLIPDAGVGGVLAAGSVDLVLVGALGVTRDGSVGDDPGAYAIAALAQRHGVPVYVCAPRQTLFAEQAVSSPRYDVVPAELVAGFVTDAGILKPPFGPSLAAIAPARLGGS